MTRSERIQAKQALVNWLEDGMEARYLADQLGVGYFDTPRDILVFVEEALDLLIETVSTL